MLDFYFKTGPVILIVLNFHNFTYGREDLAFDPLFTADVLSGL